MKLLPLMVLLGLTAQAQTLYDPAPPPNSAFLRLAGSGMASVAGRSVEVPVGGVSAYLVVPKGKVTVKVGSLTSAVQAQAGRFYTVVPVAGKLKLVDDEPVVNRAKALLTVYNLGQKPVDLKTLNGKTAVMAGVAAGASDNREVNGITVDLGLFRGSQLIAPLSGVTLARGSAYAIVVTDKAATITQSTTKSK